MRKPMLELFVISFFISVAACVIAGNVVLSSIASPPPKETVSSSSSAAATTPPVQAAVMKSNGPVSLKLIDISHYDVVTDWIAVKSVVDGIYIKATEGVSVTDPKFNEYAHGAINANIPTGFYHYFWPSADAAPARTEADHFYAAIKQYKYELCPVLDVEETSGLTLNQICASVKVFAQEFQKLSGQKIMIYCSPNYANAYLSDKSLAQYPLWIAHYNVDNPKSTIVWQNYDIWQYGTTVSVKGVSTLVDGDLATSDIFLKPGLAHGNTVKAQTLSVPGGHTAE